MKRALLHAHVWLHEVLARRRVRIVVSVLLSVAVIWGGVVVTRTAWGLQQQRHGILAALQNSSIAKNDPAAVQLLTQRTVTANGRDYGGANAIANPTDLFNDDGEINPGTRQDLAWRLVLNQVPRWMPFMLVQSPLGVALGMAAVLGALLLLVWIGLGGSLVEWGALVASLCALCWALEMTVLLQGILGAALILLLFSVLWKGVQAVLSPRASTVAVARTTVLEGIRGKAAFGFVLPVVIFLPVLALSREPHQGLYQAIPGFLDWGHTVVYASAALLVIVFGCSTTAFEIRDRQVWTVLTKPVSKLGWMAGKWLGTVALGAVVLVGGAICISAGAHYMAAQPPISERDASEVRNAVLVARVGVSPSMVGLTRDRLIEIVEAEIAGDPALKADIDNGVKDRKRVYGEVGNAKQKEFLEKQRRIAPGQYRDYTFQGLRGAIDSDQRLTLRYRFHAGADDSHETYPVIIQFRSGKASSDNDSPWDMRTWVPDEVYSYDVAPEYVNADGSFTVRLYNAGVDESGPDKRFLNGQLTMYFDADGLEVLYPRATFGDNLARAVLIDLCKISFLAALAIVASTMLSFPVAVLMTFGIFAMATLSPFLAQSLEFYDPERKNGMLIFVFQHVVKMLATVIQLALGGFAVRAPSDSLAQGRLITWGDVAQTSLVIGAGWTCCTLMFGWLVARTKEIAVYSGQS